MLRNTESAEGIETSKGRNASSRDREQVSLSYFGAEAEAIFSPEFLCGVWPDPNPSAVITTHHQGLVLRLWAVCISRLCANINIPSALGLC